MLSKMGSLLVATTQVAKEMKTRPCVGGSHAALCHGLQNCSGNSGGRAREHTRMSASQYTSNSAQCCLQQKSDKFIGNASPTARLQQTSRQTHSSSQREILCLTHSRPSGYNEKRNKSHRLICVAFSNNFIFPERFSSLSFSMPPRIIGVF